MELDHIVYLKSGSPALIVIGLCDEIVRVKNLADDDEFSINEQCLSYSNNHEWLKSYPEFNQ